MKIKEIIDALERFAPLPLQDGFDNAGLQLGLTGAEATGALLCLDVTEEVLDEAEALGANLVVAHHPLLFHAVKSLTGRNSVERCVMKAVCNGIAVYAAHTNLDNTLGGVNFKMAEKIGLTDVCVLQPLDGNYRPFGGTGDRNRFPATLEENVRGFMCDAQPLVRTGDSDGGLVRRCRGFPHPAGHPGRG